MQWCMVSARTTLQSTRVAVVAGFVAMDQEGRGFWATGEAFFISYPATPKGPQTDSKVLQLYVVVRQLYVVVRQLQPKSGKIKKKKKRERKGNRIDVGTL